MKKKVEQKNKDFDSTKNDKEVEETSDDEPSWYHYVIILAILFGIFFLISYIFNYVDANSTPKVIDVIEEPTENYVYKYIVGNVTYNIETTIPERDIRKYDFEIEPTKLDILNTINYKFNTRFYNGSDGYVSIAAVKLRNILSRVFFFQFSTESFYSSNETSCINSSGSYKIVTFDIDPNQESKVLIEDNGCIKVISKTPQEMPILMDYFVISILEDEII